MNDLSQRTAIVTGAARGLGESAARAVVSAGGKVLVTDISVERGRQVAEEIGRNARFHKLDVRKMEDWQASISFAHEELGPVTILVNNAVRMQYSSFDDLTEEEFREVFEVNELGCFLGMKAVTDSMRRAGGGSIVNVSSIAGMQPASGLAYCSSKWAIRGMTKSAAHALACDKIRVNSIHPSWMRVPSAARAPLDEVAKILPLQRVGDPDEVAKLIVFLASDDSSTITGGEYLIDCGELLLGTLEWHEMAMRAHAAD